MGGILANFSLSSVAEVAGFASEASNYKIAHPLTQTTINFTAQRWRIAISAEGGIGLIQPPRCAK